MAGYVFGVCSCHCECCEDCCVLIASRNLCNAVTDGADTWVLVSGTGRTSTEGEGYLITDNGTEVYRFDIRWFPSNGLCGTLRFVAKSRVDETGGAYREKEWGTYDLNPDDPGFEYGGEADKCPTALTQYDTPTTTESSPGPVNDAFGLDVVTFCCGCTGVPHCWLFEWDIETRSNADWTVWLHSTGSAVLYIAPIGCPSSFTYERLKCRSGVAVNEQSDSMSGKWQLDGGELNGGSVQLQDSNPLCGTPVFSVIEDLEAFIEHTFPTDGTYTEFSRDISLITGNPAPDVQVTTRGTVTWTDTYPSTEAGCACP